MKAVLVSFVATLETVEAISITSIAITETEILTKERKIATKVSEIAITKTIIAISVKEIEPPKSMAAALWQIYSEQSRRAEVG
jgi:hypothetical protein